LTKCQRSEIKVVNIAETVGAMTEGDLGIESEKASLRARSGRRFIVQPQVAGCLA
jgi:hypothetical protein